MTRYDTLLASAVDAIGETPLVELARLTRGLDGRILAKLDYLNPGFSKKDRIARQMIEDAEADGLLRPGQTVVELTSGNTGTGLAIVCAVRGYPFVAVMSRGNSVERARMMRALGAEVVLVDQLPGSVPGQVSGGDLALVEQAARAHCHRTRRVSRRSVPTPGQLPGAFPGHRAGVHPPIGRADRRVLRLRRHGRHVLRLRRRVQGVQPGHPLLRGRAGGRGDPGGRAGQLPQPSHPGRRLRPGRSAAAQPGACGRLPPGERRQAIETARRLALEEGIFAGFSSGANVAAALRLLQTDCRGGTVAVLMCDSGLKYLSTDLWE